MSNFGRMGLKSHIVRTKRITKLVYISVPTLMLLSGLILNPVTVSHEEASAATGTATAATTSLTLSSSNNSANVAITPKSANGTFAMSSAAGEAQFNVTTNNYTGYELSIVADDDSGNLTNTDGNAEHSIFSIDTPMTKDSFDTTTYNNRWGYKPSKYVANNVVIDNTGDSAVFLPSPTTTGTILDHTTIANSSANNYSIALGVRADYNTYAGSYTKAFKLQVTANPASYTINFNKNTADAVANMSTTQSSASVSTTSIALANNTPSRDSYNFLGWCTVQTTDSSCPGTTYQPGDTYGIDQTTTNIVTLYAVWQKDLPEIAIQDVTLATCPTTPTEVYDARDNEIYTIQELADGRCWLLDNLRLNLMDIPLSDLQSKTNASNVTLNYLKNGGGTTSDQYATAGVANWASSYSYSAPLIAVSGTGDDGSSWTKDTLQSYGSGSGKIGVYYNYCAASAGSYCYGNGTSAGVSSGNATEDICPAGWRMPTGGSSGGGEYQSLYIAYSSNATDFKNALRIPLSGYFYGGLAYYRGSYGVFWTSTEYFDSNNQGTYQNSNTHMYALYMAPNFENRDMIRRNGFSIRCVLEPRVNYTLSYDKNTNGVVFDMPLEQTGNINSATPIVLSENIPSRSNYVFSGWCTVEPITNNGIDSCPGVVYYPGNQYYVNMASGLSSSVLHAMWEIFPTFAIQNITLATCPTTPTRVYDIRDNEVYTIQKLADDNCWLLDNLRLNLADSTVKTSLSAANTNASNVAISYLKNGGGTASDQYATADVANADSYSYSAPLIATSGAGWTKDTFQSYGSGSGRIGVYYNYCAASAGSYCYGDGMTAGSPSGNATEDICPAGWRMPTGGGSSSEYQALYTSYSSNGANLKNALRTSPSGYYSVRDTTLEVYDKYGYFWSSDYYYSDKMYRLYVSGGPYANPSDKAGRTSYLSVRCILK